MHHSFVCKFVPLCLLYLKRFDVGSDVEFKGTKLAVRDAGDTQPSQRKRKRRDESEDTRKYALFVDCRH